jgi:hypothetical protein
MPNLSAGPVRTGSDDPIPWKALLPLILLALVLRLWGVTFGMPFDYHLDESAYRSSALDFSWEKIHPLFGPFQIFLLPQHALLRSVVEIFPEGVPGLSPEVEAALASPTMSFQLLARWNSAVFGALSVIPVFVLGRRLWSPLAGWTAAVLLAFCYIHARASHFGVPDTAMTFLALAAAWSGTRLSPRGRRRDYLLAGVAAGLAVSAKLLAWPLFVLLFLFHAFPAGGTPQGESWFRRTFLNGRLVLMAGAALASFLATAPQLLLHFKPTYAFWKFAASLGAAGGMGKVKLDEGPRLSFYFTSMRWGMGDLLLLLCLAGFVWALLGRRRGVLVLLTFPVLVLAFLCKPGNMYFARYALVAVPFLLLPGGALLADLLLRVPARWRLAAAAAALSVLVAQPAVSIVRYNRLLGEVDTRTLAKRWMEENVPDGSTILLEAWWFGPQVSSARTKVPFSRREYSLRLGGPYGASETLDESGRPVRASVAAYAESGVDYLVTNSLTSGSEMIDPEDDRAKRAFYEELDQEAELLYEVSPVRAGATLPPRIFEQSYGPVTDLARLERPGPVVKIYRLPPGPEPEGSAEAPE